MKKAISIFLAVVMVLALVACGNSAAPNAPAATNNGSETAGTDSDTIKIGYVSDLTGATALWGTAGQYGAELAVKDINEAGGVLGGKMLGENLLGGRLFVGRNRQLWHRYLRYQRKSPAREGVWV